MELEINRIESIKLMRYVQKVGDASQYYASGTRLDFIKNIDDQHFIENSILEQKTIGWMYDELYVFSAPVNDFENLDELFYYIIYATTTNRESWLIQIRDYTLVSEECSIKDFQENIEWAINEQLFTPKGIELDIDMEKIVECRRFMDSYNPLYLGYIIGDNYFFLNYNGYI